jgi:hypothetical protein
VEIGKTHKPVKRTNRLFAGTQQIYIPHILFMQYINAPRKNLREQSSRNIPFLQAPAAHRIYRM